MTKNVAGSPLAQLGCVCSDRREVSINFLLVMWNFRSIALADYERSCARHSNFSSVSTDMQTLCYGLVEASSSCQYRLHACKKPLIDPPFMHIARIFCIVI